MSKKLNVKVNGNEYEVEVSDLLKNPVAVTVNGKDYEVEFGESQSISTQTSPEVKPVSAPVVAHKAVAQAAAPAAGAGEDTIIAPMPGKIVEVSVKAGDKVTPGQNICSLEAMKMRNIIRSTRAGIVASVEVSVGDKVPYGAVLIRFA
jgi:glutaconyl-CoA/methylmalonyl-CoA decarboxylase subunit gamma